MPLPSEPLPLLGPQAAIWAAEQFGTIGRPYNLQWSVAYPTDAVAEGAVQAALDELMVRHPILHARVPSDRGVPQLVFDRPALVHHHTADHDDPDGTRLAAEIAAARARAGFDLEDSVLSDLHVIRGSAAVRVLVSQHHVVSDGISRMVLAEDVDALLGGRALRPVDDYEATHRTSLELEAAAAARADSLVEALPQAEPFTKLEPRDAEAPHGVVDMVVPGLGVGLDTLVERSGLGLSSFLIAAGVEALGLPADGCSAVVGMTATTRPAADTWCVGCFVNSVPVAVSAQHLGDLAGVVDLAGRVRVAAQHRHCPWSALVNAARRQRVSFPAAPHLLFSTSRIAASGRVQAQPIRGVLAGATMRCWPLGDGALVGFSHPSGVMERNESEQVLRDFVARLAALAELGAG